MTGVVIIVAVFLFSGLVAWLKVWCDRIRKVGPLVFAWRWMTGLPWHGGTLSDRGWFRDGTQAFTPTGHVGRVHHTRRWKVASRRSGSVLGTLLTVYGWIVAPLATEAALMLTMLAGTGLLGWSAWCRWRVRKHRKSWLAPLHLTIHHHLGKPVTADPASYIHVELDRSAGHLALPVGVNPAPDFRRALEGAVTARLGLTGPDYDWSPVAGPEPRVTWKLALPPPDDVPLGMVRDKLESGSLGQILIGLGQRASPVTINLSKSQNPHVLVNGKTGSGKSVLLRSMGSQWCFHGGFTILMDAKEISHLWADSMDGTLPNIAYVRSTEEIHAMLMWLLGEMRHRNSIARNTTHRDGRMEAKPFTPLLVIGEEQNTLAQRLTAWWKENRERDDPRECPSVGAIGELIFMGRQSRIHMVQAAQRGEAKATGGAAARENLAARIMIGSTSQRTWKMVCDEHRYPAMPTQTGRAFLVTGGVQAVQCINLSDEQAWDLALAGTVAEAPYGMPGLSVVTGRPAIESADQGTLQQDPVTTLPLISLKEAVASGIAPYSVGAVYGHRNRGELSGVPFPREHQADGGRYLYAVADLEAFYRQAAGRG